jgi:transposase
MPALPSSILEPLWVQVAALLPARHVHHPLGCHRPRVPDRVVFDKLIQVLVFGCGYRRIADQACSATTLRRRDEWITLGVVDRLRRAVLVAYDRLFGLELEHLAVDGCITKAPCGGQTAGPSPVDRRKQGHKRSTVTDAGGIPLGPLPQRPMCTWTPATTTRPTGRCWPSVPWSERVATRAMPAPVQASRRLPWSGHPCLGQPVRQAALVHRASPAGGGVLVGAGQRRHRLRPAAAARLELLPLADPTRRRP